jgi:sarcosine oxidase subunit alpha
VKTACANQRKQLVGLKPIDPTVWLPEGAQLVFNTKQAIPMKMVGHVTSSYAHNSWAIRLPWAWSRAA